MRDRRDRRDRGFAPIAAADAHTLILGSLPGRQSLEKQQYYAHPRNSFWPLMARLFEIDPVASYESRQRLLVRNGIALWDVCAAAQRPGSLDSDIVRHTAETNDFATFLGAHPDIRRVCFNGRAAEQIFRRRVLPGIAVRHADVEYRSLPSTSPAHAGMSFEEKLECWRVIVDPVQSSRAASMVSQSSRPLRIV